MIINRSIATQAMRSKSERVKLFCGVALLTASVVDGVGVLWHASEQCGVFACSSADWFCAFAEKAKGSTSNSAISFFRYILFFLSGVPWRPLPLFRLQN